MKSHARVVVVGGGIAGCSTLYHLTREGWADVVLVERDELTSGSTWHAAAQVTQFGANQTMVAMKRHSIDLYRSLAEDTDHPINYHITGGMRLAHTQQQLDIYRHYIGMSKGVGVEFELIDADEVARRHPLINAQGLLGAWWDPLDGDIDPSQLTQALARAARAKGAEVSRFNPVEHISRTPSNEWVVHTKKGDITCEIVVNASGYRVNEVGRMLGVEHPVTSMEHMYFLTDPLPALEAMDTRVPIIRDPGDDFYSRQEKQGLLVGIYEQGCKTFGMEGIDPSFTMALCPNDLDRCLDNMENIFKRLPAVADVGIHTVINGPITYTIDGAPLVGPIPGLTNAYACLGLRAGIGEGGGLGKILAELIVHGECEWDAWYLDPRRFTSHANTELTRLKAIEDYQHEFHYHLPHEQRPAGRLAKTTSLYPLHQQANAVFGVVNGWERPLFYKPDAAFIDEPGYRFTPSDVVVGAEIKRLVSGCALMEVNGFSRFEIRGAGARDFLDTMICGRLPARTGRVRLAYLLNSHGNVLSEATIAQLDDDTYWYGAAAAAEWHDRDWLLQHKPANVELRNLTSAYSILVLAGPNARNVLQQIAPRADLSAESLPWLSCQRLTIGFAEAFAMTVSYSGELAFELHVPTEQLYLAWQTLTDAGRAFDLSYFGLRAAESMRLEKAYRAWKTDLITEFNPMESALDRFTDLEKQKFMGRAGLLAQLDRAPRAQFVSLHIAGDHAPAHTGDAVYRDDQQIGSITSGGWGYRIEKHIGLSFVDPDCAQVGTELHVEILGERVPASVIDPVAYDPDNVLVRQ